jgi:hypothetical protein
MRLTLLPVIAMAAVIGCAQHAPPNTANEYMETPGTHSERPGKHSTTTGRHGTTGEVGGGINEQSGSEVAPSDHPIIEQRQREQSQ